MTRTTMALMMVATFAAAAPASAQQDSSVRLASAAVPRVDRAASLRAQAEELYSQPRQWGRAASLLERSAAAGGATDANTFASLVSAGRLRASLGEYGAARHNLEKAADHALARGELQEAAHAFIDAAFAAAADRQSAHARELLDRALLLSESPLLSAEQAAYIKRRVRA